MKNFLLLLNQQFSFSPKNEYELVAERRAAARREANKSLKNPDWRRVQDSNLQGISPTGFRNQPNTIIATLQIYTFSVNLIKFVTVPWGETFL